MSEQQTLYLRPVSLPLMCSLSVAVVAVDVVAPVLVVAAVEVPLSNSLG